MSCHLICAKSSGAALMLTPGNTYRQTFQRFFDRWLVELNTNLKHLVSAADHHNDNDNKDIEDDSNLVQLVNKCVRHYDELYKTKSDGAKGDILCMFNPTWLTSLECALLWMAGWRPTTAIHLFYSKSGLQLEAKLVDLIPVLSTGDLVRKWQLSEMMRNNEGDGRRESDEKLDSVVESKKDELVKVLQMADGLRMETLRSLVEILTPIQGVYFLIAAAELHLRLHDWGLKKDAT
ncbi:DOG1-like protein 3 [Tanacetum coccineum]